MDKLVFNTLTGYLIKLLEPGDLDLEVIIDLTLPHFQSFKNIDGKTYTSNSARRSIISALSSNKIFSYQGSSSDRIYSLNKAKADKWVQESTARFEQKKCEVSKRNRKFKI